MWAAPLVLSLWLVDVFFLQSVYIIYALCVFISKICPPLKQVLVFYVCSGLWVRVAPRSCCWGVEEPPGGFRCWALREDAAQGVGKRNLRCGSSRGSLTPGHLVTIGVSYGEVRNEGSGVHGPVTKTWTIGGPRAEDKEDKRSGRGRGNFGLAHG